MYLCKLVLSNGVCVKSNNMQTIYKLLAKHKQYKHE